MYRYECPRCRRQGLVRAETVIKANRSTIECYCGACTYTWTQSRPDAARAEPEPRKRNVE